MAITATTTDQSADAFALLRELADGRITAGATRLIYSVAILLVLAFGALVATAIADVPESFLFDVEVDDTLGFWVAWGGWIVFALGTMLTFSMHPADFPWTLCVLLLTAGAAQLGTRAFGEVIGTFLAAIAMTVAALLLGRPRNRPPAYVLYLGAFCVLTPRRTAARLRELARRPLDPRPKGCGDMISLMTALSAGMLVGAASVRRAAR